MKKITLILASVLLIISCDKAPKKRSLKFSSGRVNHVNVVIAKEQWQGQIGDVLREILAAPVDGLPQEEPLFTLKQIPEEAFTGFARENRTFIQISKTDSIGVRIAHNIYARPQTGIVISGTSENEISELIEQRAEDIIKALKTQELEADQKRISKSLKSDQGLREQLGIRLKFPTAYRYAKDEDGFFWMRKPLSNGDMNILVYEVPLKVIDQDTNTVARLVRMRDSIGGRHVPVDEGRFITERAFAPLVFETKIDGKFTWLTKGTWEVEGQRMAGPFVNYAILDEANGRYLVIEGFIFSPSLDKRDNMFELEAIIKSATFIQDQSIN